jgi:hypothetical protein
LLHPVKTGLAKTQCVFFGHCEECSDEAISIDMILQLALLFLKYALPHCLFMTLVFKTPYFSTIFQTTSRTFPNISK